MRITNHKHIALSHDVLAVAVINYECIRGTVIPNKDDLFDWVVYIGAVPGDNHQEEFMAVAKSGSKLNSKLATVLFPYYDLDKYRGD